MEYLAYDLIPNIGSFLNNYDYNKLITLSKEYNKYSLIHLYKNERLENTIKYKMKRVCEEIVEQIDALPQLVNEDENINNDVIDYRNYIYMRMSDEE